MMKMASKKRKRTENRKGITTNLDKENLAPGNVCSPPKKKLKQSLQVSQTQTCLPLGTRDTNGGGSAVIPGYRVPSMDSSVKGKERMTGQEDMKQDQEVQLSEKRPEGIPLSKETLEKYFPKTYKTRSPTNKRENRQRLPGGVSDVVSESGRVGPRTAGPPDCESQTQEVSEAPDVNRWVESRLPGDCKLETPNLKNEDLVEKWRSLCEEIGRSVCKIVVHPVSQGTGFVLFGGVIQTSAHLFRDCLDGNKLLDHISVSVDFELETGKLSYAVDKTLVDVNEQLDYAVLALIPKGQVANQPTTAEWAGFPPGLLRRCGPVTENGKVCIIGHPAGGEKTFDYAFIIETEKRQIAVKDHLAQYKGLIFTKKSIEQILVNRGINDIMMGGIKEKLVITYRSSMYEGASGSPVIDGHGRVIGLHTGGYSYQFQEIRNNVMEFALPLLTIFVKFLDELHKNGSEDLLKRVQKEAQGNRHLEEIIDRF